MRLPLLFLAFSLLLIGCKNDGFTYVLLETNLGQIKVMLYPETPRHRDNFVKLVKQGYYDGTLFHRVIPGFMIQGGDPDSRNAAPGQLLGGGGPGYELEQEIGAPHIRGALAAARTNNPEKKSSGSQFYLVTGTAQTDASLDQFERINHIKYNEAQRQRYLELGGRPDLDNSYTVFGEVVEGMDVVDKISTANRLPGDRPTENIVITKARVVN